MSTKSPKPNSRKEYRKSRQATIVSTESDQTNLLEPTSSLTQDQLESSDTCLDNENIRALEIDKEYLKNLGHLTSVDRKRENNQYPLKRVFVRKLKPLSEASERSTYRSIKVAVPISGNIVPSYTMTTLGQAPDLQSYLPGPKFNKDGSFIEHSIIGTLDDFNEVAEKKLREQDQANLNRISVSIPTSTAVLKMKPRKSWYGPLPREENALKHWDVCMKQRMKQQHHMQRILQRPAGELIMNQSDDFYHRQTVRGLIDKAAPFLEDGKGYRAGSEFWHQQEVLGDEHSGIRMSLTCSERGLKPELKIISRPNVTLIETGTKFFEASPSTYRYPWKESEYLKTRSQHLKSVIEEINPLCCTGLRTVYIQGNRSQIKHSDTVKLGSAGNSPDTSDSDDAIHPTASDYHTDNTTTLIIQPSLLIQDSYSISHNSNESVELRVSLEGFITERVIGAIKLQNTGSCVIYATWIKIPKSNNLGRVLDGEIQRFYFDINEKVILPGQEISLTIVFKSNQAGVYWEPWQILTRPPLKPINITLRGTALTQDKYREARSMIEATLFKNQAEDTASAVLSEILTSIATPPRTPSPISLHSCEAGQFSQINPSVNYREDSLRALKTLYLFSYESPPLSEENNHSDVKKEKDKTIAKKDETTKVKVTKPGSKKGEKNQEKIEDSKPCNLTILPTQVNYQVLSYPELESKLNSLQPKWDLNIESLTASILANSTTAEQTDHLLCQLSEILSGLQFSTYTQPSCDSNFQLLYTQLALFLEQIPIQITKLRSHYNLPERQFLDETLQEFTETSSSPTDISKKKKAQSKNDISKKQQKKSKEDATSPIKTKTAQPDKKRGKVTGTPKVQQETRMPDTPSEMLTKPIEVDPAIEVKYNMHIRQIVCNLMFQSIDNFLCKTGTI